MLLAIAIAATFLFLEFVALVVLSFIYDGLEGFEIWLNVNYYVLMFGGFASVVAALIALWIAAV